MSVRETVKLEISVRHRQSLGLKRNERNEKFLQNLNKSLEKLLLYQFLTLL